MGRKHFKYERITSRWGGMKLRSEFDQRIENWIGVFPESDHELVLELLLHFNYFCEDRMKEKNKALFNQFISKYESIKDVCVFTKIIKDFGVAHSEVFFTKFWLDNNIYSSSESNILGLVENNQIPQNIVIVDDYSGTGESFIETINKIIQTDKSAYKSFFYFLTVHMTNVARDNIMKYAETVGVSISIETLELSDEAFEEGYIFDGHDALINKERYGSIYNSYNLLEDYKWGYKKSASLVSFYYNTPNNTLGLFWQDLNSTQSLFKRAKKRKNRLNQMQKEAIRRKRSRDIKLFYGLDSAKLEALLTFCVTQGDEFSPYSFMQRFGLTAKQTDEILRKMISKGYLYQSNEGFSPSVMLKSRMFCSRLKKAKKRFTDDVNQEKNTFERHEEYIPLFF